jgi:DNA-binding transcriptional MocR family regulator
MTSQQQQPPPWLAAQSADATGREYAYNWEHAQSLRAKAMEWSPWQVRPAPASDIEPIMLTGGIPDPASLPVDDLLASTERVLRTDAEWALAYNGPQGALPLREWLAKDANRREGLDLRAENFVLTCGSSGAFENICEALLDPGDAAIIERPAYPGSTRIIRSCLPGEIAGVALDDDGIDCDDLERTIARLKAAGRRIKLLYTIANFHNPAASTLSIERRRRIIELCRGENILIVQDDAYGAIGFARSPVPSLFALSGGDGAVLLGTFSKTLATGLRVGWIMGSQTVIDAVTRVRFDMGVAPLTSRVLADFCESGRYDAHVPRVTEIYRQKRDAMLAALDERCASYARWSVPDGGFFLWLELAEGIDPQKLNQAALEEGVGFVGGQAFFDDGGGANFARLCYSNVAERDIQEAVLRFGRALERSPERSPERSA